MNLVEYCTQLEQQLGEHPEPKRPALAAKALQSAFKLQKDEVAIFSFEPKMEVFKFIWPTRLQTSGIVPIKAINSLVAKTGREMRGYLDNRFNKTAHTFIFEMIPDKETPESNRPIQKIMSAPLQADGNLRGVVQVSRKGDNRQQVGADFQKTELAALERIAAVLARFI
ncbi:MAG TPA: GAF domain-containing protein [Geothermobacteraceae bacterium]|nr:GAF domain-containing protein [Geothermobacteraceae bacterium]